MKSQLKFKHGLMIAILVAITFSISKCRSNKHINNLYKEFVDYKHEAKEFIAKDGTVVVYNEVLKTNLETLQNVNDSLANYINNLEIKNPETVTILDTRFQLDTIYIEYDEPVEDCRFIRAFGVEETDYSISGEVTEVGITIDSVSIPNRIGITTAEKRVGLFKKEFVVTVTNSNKLIETEGVSSYTLKQKRPLKKFILGVAAGITTAVAMNKIIK